MDKGVMFVLDNFQKTIELIKNKPEYSKYLKRVQKETIKSIDKNISVLYISIQPNTSVLKGGIK